MDHVELNRASWDERAAVHAASRMYALDRFVDDPDVLSDVVAFDRRYLPDLHGKRVVHLQCHIGTDTVSLARLGGVVTGYDVSPRSLEVARELAGRARTPVTFVEGELHDAPERLGRGSFDVVYTGVGAVNWLPSIRRWAEVVRALLAPGGQLVMREGHPVLQALDFERDDDLLVLAFPYFEQEEATVWDEPGTYTDDPTGHVWEHTVTHEWNHGIGELLTAILDVGLVLRRFEELDELEWQPWDAWQQDPVTGRFALPDARRARLPAMYALVAELPVA